ncbi:hypothetical protein KSP40_PGU020056 [Platanthera guangdongensis]|uniref:Uncharacterized protein n=1 Tax=Platanthera guangdongensis TaxID=2320717 RepID=A0ABR2LUP8_9ASPA
MGRAFGFLPYVGWFTIIVTEKPIVKVWNSSQKFIITLQIKSSILTQQLPTLTN